MNNKRVPFNKPPLTGNEEKHVLMSLHNRQISGGGTYTLKCQQWFEDNLSCKKALLTGSCTHALEIAALLLDIKKGDEVIMPSYTFVSTANAFVLRGANIVFVDIRPDTMNINELLIEGAITEKTRAIVPVHYSGVACEMDTIMAIANKYNLVVIEDAAQGMMSKYKGKALGTIGHLGCFSFHETKNYTSAGEGGLLIVNDEKYVDRAEIIREKGTNRSLFFRGAVDKYSWVDIGSSYLLNDVSAAYLWGQLEKVTEIFDDRIKSWQAYYKRLMSLEGSKNYNLPSIPESCVHNGHIMYIKVKNLDVRTKLINIFSENNICCVFHYVPLHSSLAGEKFGVMQGDDIYTTTESERIIRLPMYYGIKNEEINRVINVIYRFFNEA